MSKPSFEQRTILAERLLPGVIASEPPGRGALDLIRRAYDLADEFLADRKDRAAEDRKERAGKGQ